MAFHYAQCIRRSAAAVLLMTGAAWAQGASASLEVGTTATALRNSDAPSAKTMDGQGLLTSRAAVLDASSEAFTGSAWSDAYARVGTGFMQLRASGQTVLGGGGGVGEVSASAYAIGSMSDSFLIACPSCTRGTAATVTYALFADGGMNLDADVDFHTADPVTHVHAFGSAQSSFVMDASRPNPDWPGQRAEDHMSLQVLRDFFPAGGYYHDRPLWNEFVTASFVFGDPLSYVWTSRVDGNTAAGAYSDTTQLDVHSVFDTDYAHSFYWGGIVEVLDANGQRLEGITAFNASGVNYASALAPTALAVPEPSTWLLWAVGLVALLGSVRRGRGTRRQPVPPYGFQPC